MSISSPVSVFRATLPVFASAFVCLMLAAAPVSAADDSKSAADDAPGAPRLLPSDTLVYIRLDSADDLRKQMDKTSISKMINDPKMRPFADQFYATARDLFDQISDRVGVNLDELLSIPHGQVAFAIHPVKPLEEDEKPEIQARENEDQTELEQRRERQKRRELYSFGGTLIIDADENIDQLMAIVERFEEQVLQGRYVRRIREIGATEVTRLLPGRFGQQPIEFFEKDGTLVIGVGHSTAQDVLNHWLDKNDEPTLADNAKFGTIISRCIGAEDTRPQLTFFVDPHAIVDRIIKRSGSLTAGFIWPVIQDLGANRIGGIGGSSFSGGDAFEGIAHYHIKIDPPRDGVLGVLRPETGDTTPPNWVPDSVAGYTSINWDFEKAYDNVGKVIDKLQQRTDALKEIAEAPIEKRLGVKLREDLLQNMTGRLVRVTWMEKPIRFNSGVNVLAIEMKDALKTKSNLAQIRDRMPNQMKVDSISGHVVYRLRGPGDNFPQNMRRPEPSFMILGKWLIYADSTQFMEKAALADAGNLPRLVELPEYDLVASELGGKLDGESPFLLSFIDGAQGIRVIYDLAKDENSRNMIRRAGENNIVARKFSELLDQNELPPFSEFEKYFAPTGFFGYDEPDGIHFGFFTLRADPTDE
ncbi:DUF3352 domain-containing protein [Stieleria sp. ICT_E10.1]|uniref:DUF3352 domain-containing protein n=1 Tax=Stieleria sedimenti TaxID=2976331 RepID=UPI00217F390A|nr:DUF3352 domain-containing protein [Stieleria sedimenti]MCS7470497.1 DUF3352 domain-containing protein [Stieleria sedimenti]